MNQVPKNSVVANEIDHFNHSLVPNSDIYDDKFFNMKVVKHISKRMHKIINRFVS